MPHLKPCFCGSGLSRYPIHDRAGIFLTYVCTKCEARRKREFNPAVFDSPSYNGTEDSLEAADYDHE